MEHADANSLITGAAAALGIGLLIGAERERSKGVGPNREIAGVRTFALVSLLGAFVSVLQSALALSVFALLVGAVAIAGYVRTRETDPGVTTEIALLAAYALGALSLTHPAYSAAAAVVVTVLLASRSWLHELVTSRLSDREIYDALVLAAAVLVVLPLLPDRAVDPWGAFNPRKVWVVVVLVMTLNAVGYIGLRLWGAKTGLMVAGVLGGLVSSVSTHGAMGQRAKEHPPLAANAAAAATLSSVTTAVFLLVVVGALNASLAASLAPACSAAALTSGACAWMFHRQAGDGAHADLSLGRPISLSAALLFGAVVSGVLVISTVLTDVFGAGAGVASAAAAGFADAHSGAVSAALLERNASLSQRAAQIAVLLSFTTNAAAKLVVSLVAGPRVYAWRIAVGTLASVAAAWSAWGLTLTQISQPVARSPGL